MADYNLIRYCFLFYMVFLPACVGSWGLQCTRDCPDGFYGFGCRSKCFCHPNQTCDSIYGCIENRLEGTVHFVDRKVWKTASIVWTQWNFTWTWFHLYIILKYWIWISWVGRGCIIIFSSWWFPATSSWNIVW